MRSRAGLRVPNRQLIGESVLFAGCHDIFMFDGIHGGS